MLLSHQEDGMGRRGYPAEFRQRVLDLVAAGRRVRDVAVDLGIRDQTVYGWRRQERMDQGIEPGLRSAERAESAAARRRIRELETELAIHRKAAWPGPDQNRSATRRARDPAARKRAISRAGAPGSKPLAARPAGWRFEQHRAIVLKLAGHCSQRRHVGPIECADERRLCTSPHA